MRGYMPNWLADGSESKIIYRSDAGGSHLWVYDFTDPVNPAQQITTTPSDFRYPAWSPNGAYVVYGMGSRSGMLKLIHFENGVAVNPNNPQSISTPHVDWGGHPVWSPDSAYIAYTGYDDDDDEIYYIGYGNGVGETNFTDTHNISEQDPDWWGPTLACPPLDTLAAADLPPICQVPTATPTPVAFPTNTPTASPGTTCTAIVVESVRFRTAPSTSGLPNGLFTINNNLNISQVNALQIPWPDPYEAKRTTWTEAQNSGYTVQIEVDQWVGIMEQPNIIWVGVTVEHAGSPDSQISGYLAYRDVFTGQLFVNLSCPENQIPGWTVPPPTATPAPTPTTFPQELIWWITRHNLLGCDQSVCGLSVYTNPTASEITRITPFAESCTSVRRRDLINVATDANTGIQRVPIYWPSGSSQIGWIAIRDPQNAPEDGDYLSPTYPSGNQPEDCVQPQPTATATMTPTITPTPAPPTPTIDPSIPRYGLGRFAGITFASAFGAEAPAHMGNRDVHDLGTIDILPYSQERCIDSTNFGYQPNCDLTGSMTLCPEQFEPGQAVIEGRIPVCAVADGYVIIRGSAVYLRLDNYRPRNWAAEGYEDAGISEREIAYFHLHPNFMQVTDWENVERGDILGYLCQYEERGTCDTTNNAKPPIHLALEVRFYGDRDGRRGAIESNRSEVLGVVSSPNCLFDNWAPSNDDNPRAPNSPLVACPQN